MSTKRYEVRWFMAQPCIVESLEGTKTYLEAQEEIVNWYVSRAEWWIGLSEEEFHSDAPTF